MAVEEDMKLTVRAVTRNWLKSDPKRTADCMVEFETDTDADSANEEIRDRISEFEQEVSAELFSESVKGGADEFWCGSMNGVIDRLLVSRFGSVKLADLMSDNCDVPYLEFEWNGWGFRFRGVGSLLRFGRKPWSGLRWNTRKKAERDMAEFELGKTELSGTYGRPITFGEYRSRFLLDGSLKPEFWK